MPESTQQLVPDAPLDIRVEALLFAGGGSVKKGALLKQLNVTPEDLETALHSLDERLASGATRIVETDGAVSLVTAPSVSEMVEQFYTKEFKEDIGDAGLEVLAIVLYRGKSSRASIDYIRGVNSAATIRALTMRGLIERSGAGENASYQATPALLSHFGVIHVSDLPQYEEVLRELAEFEKNAQAVDDTKQPDEPVSEEPNHANE